jgi:hypothetical protein
MISTGLFADLLVFVGEIFVVAFGSLFLALLLAEFGEWWKARREG